MPSGRGDQYISCLSSVTEATTILFLAGGLGRCLGNFSVRLSFPASLPYLGSWAELPFLFWSDNYGSSPYRKISGFLAVLAAADPALLVFLSLAGSNG